MNKKQHEALKLANKMYLNSYECMWNDAMIHSHKNLIKQIIRSLKIGEDTFVHLCNRIYNI